MAEPIEGTPKVGHAGVPRWIKVMWVLGVAWVLGYIGLGLSRGPEHNHPHRPPLAKGTPPPPRLKQVPPPQLEPAPPEAATSATPKPAVAPAPAIAADVAKESQALYTSRCASCHGTAGAGDGPVAAAMTPKPRNYRDHAWQASVTDAQLGKVIVEGGVAVGKSPLMPGSPDLAQRPEVVRELVRLIRGFDRP